MSFAIAPVLGGSNAASMVEQAGAPTAIPNDPTKTNLIQDTLTDTVWSWDVADQVWRSVGLVGETVTLPSLPANIWTNLPGFSLLNTVEQWDAFDSAGNNAGLLETRRRADGFPQVRSLHAYTNLRFDAVGYGVITP